MGVLERAGVGGLDLLDDLGHAVRAEEGRAFPLLDLADLLGHAGASVQQIQQLLVDIVDLHAQMRQIGRGLGWGAHGRGVVGQALRCSNSRMYSTSACTPAMGMAL